MATLGTKYSRQNGDRGEERGGQQERDRGAGGAAGAAREEVGEEGRYCQRIPYFS